MGTPATIGPTIAGTVDERGLGGMVPVPESFGGIETDRIRLNGRPQRDYRAELRQIPNVRNAAGVVSVYAQTAAIVWAAVQFGPWTWVPAFVLMGRAHAQFAAQMHEAAHRLLFSNKWVNDQVGRWLVGAVAFTNTDGYRRGHMAHHREEFGPREPDIPLYRAYPISRASMRRKLVRDATGRTGYRLLLTQFRSFRAPLRAARHSQYRIWSLQLAMLLAGILAGYPLVYPLLWLLPYLTVWRVINRLRAIAEHGGMHAAKERRATTHSVRQHWLARFYMVPYAIGFHLAHHVDMGVPMRHLPKYHRAMAQAGFVSDDFEYPSYRALWRRLASG